MLNVVYRDQSFSVNDLVPGTRGMDLFAKVKIKAKVYGYKYQGKVYDLHMPLPSLEGSIEIFDGETPEGLDIIRHSCAHLLAQAVKSVYPKTQVTIGPVIENGFFYDFSIPGGFKEEDLPVFEAKMKEIVKARLPVKREEWSQAKAIQHFSAQNEHYKCEIIRDLGEPSVSVYWNGDDFVDLCRGPHVVSTGFISAFKLTHLAGAYWRGDEKNEMLTRIYGIAFGSEKELQEHLVRVEEAKKRDHRRIGTELDLFSFHPEAPAAPFIHPRGAFIYNQIQEFMRQLNYANGFTDVVTPLVMQDTLWKKSGHYENYKENMYFVEVDEQNFAIKPMNCPGHCLIFGNHSHSYRDLPMRLSEFGRVHRHERSGVTAGMFRVRSFVQDDAHVYCTEDQVQDEILHILKMIRFTYGSFDFDFRVELSTRPEKRQGSDELWDKAEGALAQALKMAELPYQVNPGDGAFYGPKIDFHLKDSIGRSHQCGTIQLDFSMPGRFDLEYVGTDNKRHTPVMIHRAIVGSFERFFGILIEHYAGRFPLWLSPTQIAIMSVAEEANSYCEQVALQLREKGFRVECDTTSEKLGTKIRKFQMLRTPMMLTLGAKEAASQQLSLRKLDGSQSHGLTLASFLDELAGERNPITEIK